MVENIFGIMLKKHPNLLICHILLISLYCHTPWPPYKTTFTQIPHELPGQWAHIYTLTISGQ